MKLQIIDNSNNEVLFNIIVSDSDSLSSGLDVAEKRLKESAPNYEKGCYTIVQSVKGITYNVFNI